jgi:hypothetical protein
MPSIATLDIASLQSLKGDSSRLYVPPQSTQSALPKADPTFCKNCYAEFEMGTLDADWTRKTGQFECNQTSDGLRVEIHDRNGWTSYCRDHCELQVGEIEAADIRLARDGRFESIFV